LYYLWQIRFENQNIGMAATLTVLFVAILLVFTITNFWVSERKEA